MEFVLQCTCCKLTKPTDDFTRDKAKRNGFKSICKACSRVKQANRRLNRSRQGGYVATTPAEREKQEEIKRLCGAMRVWGHITRAGNLVPIIEARWAA